MKSPSSSSGSARSKSGSFGVLARGFVSVGGPGNIRTWPTATTAASATMAPTNGGRPVRRMLRPPSAAQDGRVGRTQHAGFAETITRAGEFRSGSGRLGDRNEGRRQRHAGDARRHGGDGHLRRAPHPRVGACAGAQGNALERRVLAPGVDDPGGRMRFLFAVTLTSLVLFESIEVATPGHTTSAQGVRSNRERGAYCEAASVRQDPLASGALA